MKVAEIRRRGQKREGKAAREGQSGVVILVGAMGISPKKVNQGWFAWRGMWRIDTKGLFEGCKSWWDYH